MNAANVARGVAVGIWALLAVALAFGSGCGPVGGPYLHTGLDSADTGDGLDGLDDYADVAGLPDCAAGWVRLPPSSDDVDRLRDFYTFGEVHAQVYGDPDWSGPPARLIPVVYRTFNQDSLEIGWQVGGDVVPEPSAWTVLYQPFPDWSEDTQPFTLACG